MRCSRHRLGALFEIAVLTGLRRAELCGLRWSDVDLAAGKITVRRSRVSVRGRVLEQATTKTRAGLRTVPLSDAAVSALLSWQLRQAEETEAAPEAWRTEGHVFTMEDGRALDPSYVTRLFSTLRKVGGEELPPLSFHGLRHCSASLMLASGADIAVVSKLLGHASIAITADVVRPPGRYHRPEGRERCREPDCTHSAHTSGGGRLMRVSSSAARGPPTRGNSRRAGVAQSVAQLSCKQQVRGSSPLASSLTRANTALTALRLSSPHRFPHTFA